MEGEMIQRGDGGRGRGCSCGFWIISSPYLALGDGGR